MNLKKITVTGVDNYTAIPDIFRMIARYPQVEFGVLIQAPWGSEYQLFPSFEWIERLARYIDESLRQHFSLHLCGGYVQDFYSHKRFVESVAMFAPYFGRMQINTHNERAPFDLKIAAQNVHLLNGLGVTPILQMDEANAHIVTEVVAEVPRGAVDVLYDMSHGAGVLPTSWEGVVTKPNYGGIFTGYAGGLEPANVRGEVAKIAKIVGDNPIWIDAESRLRSGGNFDMVKAALFVKHAYLASGQFPSDEVDGDTE